MDKELSTEGFVFKRTINGFVKKDGDNEYVYKFEPWPFFGQVLPHYEIIVKAVEDIKKRLGGNCIRNFHLLAT